MRCAFVKMLLAEAKKHGNLWLLYGDLGYGVLDPFIKKFPHRSINCGCAEQNMMGVAAGLAASERIVFVYSICNFVMLRCLEQVRNDVAYPRANVKIVGVGVGEDYGLLGYTHHGIEDAKIARTLPNLHVVTPKDVVDVKAVVGLAAETDGPFYIRLRR